MSKIENLNISVSGKDDYPTDPIIIHILEGPAPEPLKVNQPKSVAIEGAIDSPLIYAIHYFSENTAEKPHVVHPEIAVVVFSDSPKNPYIKLTIDPGHSISTTVTGKLKPNTDLAAFRFNEAGSFTNKTFSEMIIKHAHCFANKGEAKTLRKSLQNYQAKFNTVVQKANDNQGNTEDFIKTEFDKTGSGIPQVINLKMPLFDGGGDIEFSAEVEIEVVMISGKPEARFAFFTEELDILHRANSSAIISHQINELSEHFVCIRENNYPMSTTLSLLIVSAILNLLLTLNLLLLKSDLEQQKKLLTGTLMEKGRLRRMIRQIKINQN